MLACTHMLYDHAQEATDTYKALLLEHRDLLALNVYVALCYAKLDYYDVSSEILQVAARAQHLAGSRLCRAPLCTSLYKQQGELSSQGHALHC